MFFEAQHPSSLKGPRPRLPLRGCLPTSRLSANFEFHTVLLQNRAYKSTLTALLRRIKAARASANTPDTVPPTEPQDELSESHLRQRSSAIDRQLEKDLQTLPRQAQILAVGVQAPALIHTLKSTQHSDKSASYDWPTSHVPQARQSLVKSLRLVIDSLAPPSLESTESITYHRHNAVLGSEKTSALAYGSIDASLRDSLCWCDEYINRTIELEQSREDYDSELSVSMPTVFRDFAHSGRFLGEASRLPSDDYRPSEHGITLLRERMTGIQETTILVVSLQSENMAARPLSNF